MLTQTVVWIWASFSVVGVLMMALFAMLARAQRRAEDRMHGLDGDPVDVAREANELEGVAAHTLWAAQQAATAAEYAESELAVAEEAREKTWQEHNLATEAVEKATAELESMPVDAILPDETQREVSRAARDAYRRGELSLEQLRAVWHKVDGWGESLEDKTHEVSRLRAEAAEAYRRFHVAALAERRAQKSAEVAQVAARALQEEATEAARDAVLAQMRLPKKRRRR